MGLENKNMQVTLPYSPTHSQEWLEQFFEKNYYKKSYDRFMWWRSYSPKRKPLHPRSSLLDRILNGDFDLASYKYEVEAVEHKLNQKFIDLIEDQGRYVEEASLDRARRKRLLEDFEKDELSKLAELKKQFLIVFKITEEEYEQEILNTDLELVDFYYFIEEKYGKYWIPMK